MALGIMIATIVVGCTIVIGLFEWRDRNSMENRNAELHLWRKSMYDLNIHVTKLALLGETAADWDSSAANEYHRLSADVSSRLQNIAGLCTNDDIRSVQKLLKEKERLLLAMRNAIHECNDIHSRFTTEVPKIVEKSKFESRRVVSSAQEAQKKKKKGFFSRLFGKKSEKTDSSKVMLRHSETARMLTTLHNDLLTRHQQQSSKVSGILDSLRIRNEVINKHLQNVITVLTQK